MDYNNQTRSKMIIIILIFFVVVISVTLGLWELASILFQTDIGLQFLFWGLTSLSAIAILAVVLANIISKPLQTLSDVIVYTGHKNRSGMTAPDPNKLRIGRKLIASLTQQIYDMSSMADHSKEITQNKEDSHDKKSQASILDHINMPIIGIDSKQNVTMVNRDAIEYLNKEKKDIIGKPVYDAASMSFKDDATFEQWLGESQKNTAINNMTWERVRIVDADGNAKKQFDLVASFSKENQTGTETILVIFDRTEQYYKR